LVEISIGGGRRALVAFVEEACAPQPRDGLLYGRCVGSVARTFGRVLDAKAEGRRRYVRALTELLHGRAEAGGAGSRSAAEHDGDVGAEAPAESADRRDTFFVALPHL
jgi:hypothetical protein